MNDGGVSEPGEQQQEQQQRAKLYEAVLRHCCSKCREYLHPNQNKTSPKTSSQNDSLCWLCLGLWQDEGNNHERTTTTAEAHETLSCLRSALEARCQPYGGIGGLNRFGRLPNQTHTVSLSGDLCLRYKWLASMSPPSVKPSPFADFLQDLKHHLHARIKSIVQNDTSATKMDEASKTNQHWRNQHPRVFETEEQGSLSIHVLCLPPKDHPMNALLNEFLQTHPNQTSQKHHQKRYHKRQRCGPYTTQGGDPRQNLDVRLRARGYEWISQATADDLSSTSSSLPSWASFLESRLDAAELGTASATGMEYHVAVFRRPMFLYGYYTKSRRDVSQSPFVVMREKQPAEHSSPLVETNDDSKPSSTKEAEVLGVTSVEEQICGPIQDLLGVSTQNNLVPEASTTGGGVMYGMIKFHASGREDMDVRMLVRNESPTCHGRPFCVQIIDALKPIVSADQLSGLVETINHTTAEKATPAVTSSNEAATESKGFDASSADGLCNTGASFYGQNPMGVGILPNALRPVSSAVFSGLQKDTESKTKHYGCYCWSKNVLPDGDDLTEVLFRDVVFPLTIQQRTPFRVLHRRTNTIRERNVLRAKATRIDDHHFRLELSTQAGTYVKEFVYGDFGRTIPSVSSIMGCKTNLLKLDCEGIEIPQEEAPII